MRWARAFHGWVGSGVCDGCGNRCDRDLGVWTETEVSRKKVVPVRQYVLCMPCTNAERRLSPYAASSAARAREARVYPARRICAEAKR